MSRSADSAASTKYEEEGRKLIGVFAKVVANRDSIFSMVTAGHSFQTCDTQPKSPSAFESQDLGGSEADALAGKHVHAISKRAVMDRQIRVFIAILVCLPDTAYVRERSQERQNISQLQCLRTLQIGLGCWLQVRESKPTFTFRRHENYFRQAVSKCALDTRETRHHLSLKLSVVVFRNGSRKNVINLRRPVAISAVTAIPGVMLTSRSSTLSEPLSNFTRA